MQLTTIAVSCLHYILEQVITTSVATGSGHPDYPGHLDHFLSALKWVSPGHTNIPDPDQKYLSIID